MPLLLREVMRVGHLPLGKSGKFAKIIFYFLKANKKTFMCNQGTWEDHKRW